MKHSIHCSSYRGPGKLHNPKQCDCRPPQRFKYRDRGGISWQFGACFPVGGARWQIIAGKGFSLFDEDPWEIMGQILGDIEAFEWIDNDLGWHGYEE
jgi:hypothetical protein